MNRGISFDNTCLKPITVSVKYSLTDNRLVAYIQAVNHQNFTRFWNVLSIKSLGIHADDMKVIGLIVHM